MAVIDDLVAYWSLDEASGDAVDAHGSNDLTDNNTVGAASGKVSGARDFEAGSGEFFSINDNADLSLGSDTPFTFAGWIKNENDFEAGRVWISKLAGFDDSTVEYLLWVASGIFIPQFIVGNGTSRQSVNATGVFLSPANTWFFVVAWHDPVANEIAIQVDNGTPVTASWSSGTQNSTSNFRMGSDGGSYGNVWDGLMDEWGFWKKVLTSDERTWLYNSGSGRSYADIVAEAGGGGFIAFPRPRGLAGGLSQLSGGMA